MLVPSGKAVPFNPELRGEVDPLFESDRVPGIGNRPQEMRHKGFQLGQVLCEAGILVAPLEIVQEWSGPIGSTVKINLLFQKAVPRASRKGYGSLGNKIVPNTQILQFGDVQFVEGSGDEVSQMTLGDVACFFLKLEEAEGSLGGVSDGAVRPDSSDEHFVAQGIVDGFPVHRKTGMPVGLGV